MLNIAQYKDFVQLLVSAHESSLLDLLKLRLVNKLFQSCVDKTIPIHDIRNEKIMIVHWIVSKGDYQLLRQETMRICARNPNKTERQNALYTLHSLIYYGILDILQDTTLDELKNGHVLEKLLHPRDELWSMNLWTMIIDGDPGKFYSAHIRLREYFIERFDVFSKHFTVDVMCDFFFLRRKENLYDHHLDGAPMVCHIPDQHFEKILFYFETNVRADEYKKKLWIFALYSAQSNLQKYIYGCNQLKRDGIWECQSKEFLLKLAIPSKSVEILTYLNEHKPSLPKSYDESHHWVIGHHILEIKDTRIRKSFIDALRVNFEDLFIDWEIMESKEMMSQVCYSNKYMMVPAGIFQLRNHDMLYRSMLKLPFNSSPLKHIDITVLFCILHSDRTTSQDRTYTKSYITNLIESDKQFVFHVDFQLLCWIITRRIFFQKLNPGIDDPQYSKMTQFIKETFIQITNLEKRCCNSTYAHSSLSLANCVLQMEKYLSLEEIDNIASYYSSGFPFHPIHNSTEYDVWVFYGKPFSYFSVFMDWTNFERLYTEKTDSFKDLNDEQIATIAKNFPRVIETVRKKETVLDSFKNLGLIANKTFHEEKVSFSDLKYRNTPENQYVSDNTIKLGISSLI